MKYIKLPGGHKLPIVTGIILFINIAVFIILEILGDTEDTQFMLNHGAMYTPYIINDGEWYRLITCIFMHFGFPHLIYNMLMLVSIGNEVEETVGRLRFFIIYIGSGLIGNIATMFADIVNEEWVVSAGASGAIMGIVGALLLLAIVHRQKAGIRTIKGILFFIVISVLDGMASEGVDNSAHIGGLISGFVIAALVCGAFAVKKYKKLDDK